MKNIIFALFGILSLAAVITASRNADADARAFQSTASTIYEYTWTADTITNSGSDTLTIPTNLVSLWSYNYTVTAANVSGTTNIVAILQERNGRTGAWYEVERDSIAAAGTKRLHGGAINALGYVKGLQQRIILTGYNTQVSTYLVKATLKKH